jgi:hypothetical protein
MTTNQTVVDINMKNESQSRFELDMKKTENEANCCVFISSSICYLFLFALPITQIGYSNLYKVDCETHLVPLNIWLLVEGVTGVCIITFEIVRVSCDDKNLSFCLFVPQFLFNTFKLMWLIIGSVVFFRDCYNCKPQSFNTLMWISIILGYLGICGSISSSRV